MYRKSLETARQSGEIASWRESHRENIACKEDIEEAIRVSFNGMNLELSCVEKIVSKYGMERVKWVLANTLQEKNYDDRFSRKNREWAANFDIPNDGRNYEFMVDSHPYVLNDFVDEFLRVQTMQMEQDEMEMK